MIKLYLVRHGENLANLTKEFSHRKVDYSLTPKGRLQAEQAAAYFRDRDIHAVFSSPLKRAMETAVTIAGALGQEYTVVEEFRELNVGELEDPPPSEEKWRIHHGVWLEWFNGNRATAFPGGENHTQACARMRQGLESTLAGREGQNLIVSGHGGLFLASLGEMCSNVNLAIIFLQEYHNGSISEIDFTWDGKKWAGEMIRWGDTSHLHGDAGHFVSAYPELKD